MRIRFWTHYSVVGLLLFAAVLVGLIIATGFTPAQLWWLLLPVVLAPFYEWAMHKWVLHAALPEKPGLHQRMAMRLHHQHHIDPKDETQTFAPVWAILILIVKFALIFALLLGFKGMLMPLLGVVLYYVFYEWMHFSHHDSSYKPVTRYGQTLKKAHMHHHFHNHHYWWGVTNDLADRLFATGGRFKGIERLNDTRHISPH